MTGYRTGIALTLHSSSFFGLMGTANKVAKEGGLGLYERITLRFLVATLLLWIVLKVQGKSTTLYFIYLLMVLIFALALDGYKPSALQKWGTLIRTPHIPIVWNKAVGGIAALAVLSTVLACSFFSLGIRTIGSEKASILSVFEPVTAILAGVLLLGESLPATFTLGAILIILGSVLVSKNKKVLIPILQEKKDIKV